MADDYSGMAASLTIQVWDEAVPGGRAAAGCIGLDCGRTTARQLIAGRVRQEVERYNASLPEVFHGLVQPEESEQLLNGYRMKLSRPLDAEAQCRRAFDSFSRNGFLLLVNGRQVCGLDTEIEVGEGAEAQFVKLVPLVGG